MATGHGHHFRLLRTNNERRQIASSVEQGVPVRAKRNGRGLPNSWDDFNRSTWGIKWSWKYCHSGKMKPHRQWAKHPQRLGCGRYFPGIDSIKDLNQVFLVEWEEFLRYEEQVLSSVEAFLDSYYDD